MGGDHYAFVDKGGTLVGTGRMCARHRQWRWVGQPSYGMAKLESGNRIPRSASDMPQLTELPLLFPRQFQCAINQSLIEVQYEAMVIPHRRVGHDGTTTLLALGYKVRENFLI